MQNSSQPVGFNKEDKMMPMTLSGGRDDDSINNNINSAGDSLEISGGRTNDQATD